jgi:hypothetical protein
VQIILPQNLDYVYFLEKPTRVMDSVSKKALRWMIFNVVIALIPLAARAIIALFHKKPVSIEAILLDGELLLVTAAINAGAIGELIGTANKRGLYQIVVVGASMVSLIFSCLLYAHIIATGSTGLDEAIIYKTSIGLFGVTFIAGLNCIILSELE